MVCSNCGYTLGPDDQFCGGCGAYLTDAPEPEATQPEDDWGIPFDQSPTSPTPAREPRGGAGGTVGVIAGALAALLIVGLALFWILGRDDDTDAANAPATTPVTTATTPVAEATEPETPTEEPTEQTPSPTEEPTTPDPEPTEIELPGSAAQCQNVGSFAVYRGNDQTSCQFSENVARAYAALTQPVTEATTLEGVSSPVTGQTYTLTCDHSTPVRCTGGNNAVIYLSPSS